MGLLDRTLKYKKEINMRGQETIMDRIAGPADSRPIEEDHSLVRLKSDDLKAVNNAADADIYDDGVSAHEHADDLSMLPEEDISDSIRIIEDLPEESGDDASAAPSDWHDEPDLKTMRLSLEDDGLEDGGGAAGKTAGHDFEDTLSGLEEEAFEDFAKLDVEQDEGGLSEELESFSQPEDDFNFNEDAAENSEFSDYALLYETENELIRSADKNELFDVILFSLMGHLGCSSASLISQESFASSRWIVALSKGIELDTEGLFFFADRGFLSLFKESKEILDIDDYKDKNNFTDEYLDFLSLDGRYMIPITYNGKLLAAVLLSDRLEREGYSSEENYFITSLCETAGIVLNRLLESERMNAEITELKSSIDEIKDIESFEEQFACEGTIDGMTQIIRGEFRKYGIDSYAIFSRSRQSDSISLIMTEENSAIGLKNSDFLFEEKSPFIIFMGKSGRVMDVDGFRQTAVIKQVFKNEQIQKMSMFRIYPYISGGRNIGFIIIFGLRDNAYLNDIDLRMQKISRFVFNAFYLIQDVDINYSRYTDNVESIYKRINREIDNAAELEIPLALLLFSIKNFKRYYNRFGEEQANLVLSNMEKNIRVRLSDSDFSFRYGRSRFLIVLPGKDKKLALQLGAAIRNAIKQNAGEGEVPLLMTFLAAQYPDDGRDVFTLFDFFE